MSDLRQQFHFDETEEKVIIESVQDCTPVLEQAKRLHNEGIHGSNEMRHVARFPKVLVEKYCNVNGVSFAEFLANSVHIERMLKDPDLSGFRIGKF